MSLLLKSLRFLTKQQKPFKVNILKNMLVNSSAGLTQQYQSIYVTLLGATAIQLGYLASLGGIANVILSIPIGLLADRQGVKRMIMASLILYIIGFSIFGLAQSWEITAFAFLFTSIAMLIANNACPMVCGACLNSVERTTGMQLCDTVTAIPRLIVPIISAFVISYLGGLTAEGIRPLYWLGVAGVLIALLVIVKLFQNPTLPKPPESRDIVGDFRRVFQEGVKVKRWLIYYMLMTIPWYISFYIPLYAKQVKGASTFVLGFMDSGYWLAIVLLALPIGLAADRFGRKKIIAILVPIFCLGLLILWTANNDIALLSAGALNGFVMLAAVTESSITVELVPRELLGSWFGILGFFMGLTSFAAPIIGGYLWGVDPVYVLLFISVTQIAKLGILAGMPSKTKYS
jgi:ACS family glucarate transporter-like MFS transporter